MADPDHRLHREDLGADLLLRYLIVVLLAVASSACTRDIPLGDARNPIKISLVPGQDTKVLEENANLLKGWLREDLGLHFSVNVPVNFVAVVEALGTKRADIAFMNTFGYILANEKYGARVRLIGIFKGTDVYYGQIIAHKDGPQKVEDIDGKSFAFVDPASTSGYLLAAKLFREKNVKPKNFVFAGRHDSVAMMVYQKRVDAGATFHALEADGQPQDARKLIKAQFPDVFEKVRILAKTGPIPNDPVVFRKDFPLDLQEKIVDSMKKFIKTEEGLKAMDGLYHMSDLRDASDADYTAVKKMLLDLGKSAGEFIK